MAKRLCSIAGLVLACLLLICGCAPASPSASSGPISFTDAKGRTVTVTSHDRVVCLYGSFSETWLLSGGTLAGTTNDAITERQLDLGEDVADIGTVKNPNLETIFAVDPDFVILSADIQSHAALDTPLTEAGIPHAYFQVDTFDDYLAMLNQFCQMTGRMDLYEKNGTAVQLQIDEVLERVKDQPHPTVLLIRAYSSGAKAKTDDNLAGVILRDLGCDNIASRHPSLLEDLSLETVVAEDPDFIFITTMGSDSEAALQALESRYAGDPAWAGLQAVQNNRCLVLPKELFHYKPNARWGESYAYLANLLYP